MLFSNKIIFKDKAFPQFYILRVSPKFSDSVSLRLFGGLSKSEKSFKQIKEEAEKAFWSGYKRVLLPWNFVFHSEKYKLAEWIVSKPSHFVLALHPHSFKSFQNLFPNYKEQKLYLELNLESYDSFLFFKT